MNKVSHVEIDRDGYMMAFLSFIITCKWPIKKKRSQ